MVKSKNTRKMKRKLNKKTKSTKNSILDLRKEISHVMEQKIQFGTMVILLAIVASILVIVSNTLVPVF